MINYLTWLRLIQHKTTVRSCCAWPDKRISLVKKLCSYCGNKTPESHIRPINQSVEEKSSQQKKDSPQKGFEQQSSQHKQDSPQGPNRLPLKPKSNRDGNRKRSKWRYGYTIFLSGLCGTVLWAIYELGKPEEDQRGRSIEDELSSLPPLQQYLQRMWRSVHYYQKMLEEPMPTRLLPDVLQAPYVQPRYTLVLEMKDVLVHPDWTYQTGWRFKKRPGVDHFLRQCSRHFEIIVYTAEQGTTAFPILDALDPNGYIRYRLVRGAMQVVDGQHIKNLNRLNRNLRRVIVVDWNRQAIPLHPDNIFAISRWLGNDDDVQLFDLAAFLGLIAEHKMDDVREVLHYYRQFEDPIEQFKENQRKLLEIKQETPDTEPVNPHAI